MNKNRNSKRRKIASLDKKPKQINGIEVPAMPEETITNNIRNTCNNSRNNRNTSLFGNYSPNTTVKITDQKQVVHWCFHVSVGGLSTHSNPLDS